MYCATEPSLVTRVAFFCATAAPRLRRITTAFSASPLASVRAFLQSIMGAPVRSRSSLTLAAEMLVCLLSLVSMVAIIEDDSFIILQKLTRASRGPDRSGAKPRPLDFLCGTAEAMPSRVTQRFAEG